MEKEEETNKKLKIHEKEEKFTCIFCAMIYRTNEYSDREPFRKYYDKIWSKCPRCEWISYKTVEKPKDEIDKYKGEDY